MCWLVAVLSWASSWSLQITTAASRYIYIYPGVSEYLLSPPQLNPNSCWYWNCFSDALHFTVWHKYLQDCTIFCLNGLKYFGEISRYKTFYWVGLETLKLEGAKNRIKCPKTIQLILWLWQIVWSIVRSYGFKKSFFLVSFPGYRYYFSDEDWGRRPPSLSNTSPSLVRGSAVISR